MECEVLLLGFGPITQAFAKSLIAKGHKVVVVSQRLSTKSAGAEFPLDSFHVITWQDVVAQEIRSESTYIGWRQSPQSQPLGVKLVEWVKSDNFRTEKIHHLSSASVYSGYQELFSEKDYNSATNSKNMNSKQFLEKFVINLSREKETEVINYRISNVYGSGMRQGFINESINNLKNGQPITIYKEMDLIRDYLLIDDLISGLIDLRLNDSSGEVLNLSTGCGMAISEIIAHLQSLGINDMKLIEIATPENTVPRSVLSCKKLEEIVSWKPQIIGKTLHRLVQELV